MRRYWSHKEVAKTKASLRMIIGGKNIGKSYDIKKYELIEHFWRTGKKFIYFRRYKEDMTDYRVEKYWSDMVENSSGEKTIARITGGEWTKIKVWKKGIYLARDVEVVKKDKETGEEYTEYKTEKGPQIGDAVEVSKQGCDHISSLSFVGYDMGVFEEFLTLGMQDKDEPDIFMTMLNTIFRDGDFVVYLLGNRITRLNPYFRCWNLTGAVNQKPGTIEVYNWEREVGGKVVKTKLAIEQCGDYETQAKFFGNRSTILGTEYNVTSDGEGKVFHGDMKDLELLYPVLFKGDGVDFVLTLVYNKVTGSRFCLVSPHDGFLYIRRIIQSDFSEDRMITNCLNEKIKAERRIAELMRTGKIAYTDRLTATEFPVVCRQIGVRVV